MTSEIDDRKCGELSSVLSTHELKTCMVWFQNLYQEMYFHTDLVVTLIEAGTLSLCRNIHAVVYHVLPAKECLHDDLLYLK